MIYHTECGFDQCPLFYASQTRKCRVQGSGDKGILIVGEAPGRDEDAMGVPFVGPAGKLLRSCMESAKMPFDYFYVTNAVRCTPYEDPKSALDPLYQGTKKVRTPLMEEWNFCKAHFFEDLKAIRPKVILTLGKTPFTFLTGSMAPIKETHGGVYRLRDEYFKDPINLPEEFRQTAVVPTYHPASYFYSGRNAYIPTMIEEELRKVLGMVDNTTQTDIYSIPIRLINDTQEAIQYLEALAAKKGLVAYDIESIGFNPWDERFHVVGMSFADSDWSGVFIPLHHIQSRVNIADVLPSIKKVLRDCAIIAHNGKFDYLCTLVNLGLDVNLVHDTMTESFFLFGEGFSHELKSIANRFWHVPNWSMLVGSKDDLSTVDLDRLARYGGLDSVFTWQIHHHPEIGPAIQNDKHLYSGYRLVMDLVRPVVRHLEYRGATNDLDLCQKFIQKYEAVMAQMYEEMFKHPSLSGWAGKVNLSSLKSLRRFIFEDMTGLNLESVKQTASDCASLDVESLTKLREKYASREEVVFFLDRLKQYRTVEDYRGSLDGLLKHRKEKSFVHPGVTTFYKLTGTRSGRLSASDISLQTVDPRSDMARCFVPSNDIYVSADYSQLELRVIAAIAGEENMVSDFMSGHDIHTATASKIFHVEPDVVTKLQRKFAKTINFGIIYGMSSYKLARDLNIEEPEAQKIIDAWFDAYPAIRKYIKKCHQFAKRRKYIEIPTGRRRYFPKLRDEVLMKDPKELAEILRQSQNTPIQGAASDINCFAFTQIWRYFENGHKNSYIWAIIHDAIKFDVAWDELRLSIQAIQFYMEKDVYDRFKFMRGVPLDVTLEIGANWGDLVDLEGLTPHEIVVKGPKHSLMSLIKKVDSICGVDYTLTPLEGTMEDCPPLWDLIRGYPEKVPVFHGKLLLKKPLF